jgi:hypothetical protein
LLAGQIASHIFYNGQSLLAFKMTIAGFVAFFVVAVLAPLFLFTPEVARAKREGLAEYAAFASSVSARCGSMQCRCVSFSLSAAKNPNLPLQPRSQPPCPLTQLHLCS